MKRVKQGVLTETAFCDAEWRGLNHAISMCFFFFIRSLRHKENFPRGLSLGISNGRQSMYVSQLDVSRNQITDDKVPTLKNRIYLTFTSLCRNSEILYLKSSLVRSISMLKQYTRSSLVSSFCWSIQLEFQSQQLISRRH